MSSQQLEGAVARALKSVDDEGRRLMLIVTSNAYRDREAEIISERALATYVEKSWRGDQFVGRNPLLLWHDADPIGDIIYADMEGPFLIEVALERPDGPVNLAAAGEPPIMSSVKAVWDALEREPDLAASHQFQYRVGDEEDGVYEEILKRETSVLPRRYAANAWTSAEVIRPRS